MKNIHVASYQRFAADTCVVNCFVPFLGINALSKGAGYGECLRIKHLEVPHLPKATRLVKEIMFHSIFCVTNHVDFVVQVRSKFSHVVGLRKSPGNSCNYNRISKRFFTFYGHFCSLSKLVFPLFFSFTCLLIA